MRCRDGPGTCVLLEAPDERWFALEDLRGILEPHVVPIIIDDLLGAPSIVRERVRREAQDAHQRRRSERKGEALRLVRRYSGPGCDRGSGVRRFAFQLPEDVARWCVEALEGRELHERGVVGDELRDSVDALWQLALELVASPACEVARRQQAVAQHLLGVGCALEVREARQGELGRAIRVAGRGSDGRLRDEQPCL